MENATSLTPPSTGLSGTRRWSTSGERLETHFPILHHLFSRAFVVTIPTGKHSKTRQASVPYSGVETEFSERFRHKNIIFVRCRSKVIKENI